LEAVDDVDVEAFTRDQTSASGQVFEFRLWAALTEQSGGSLHVFLPLSDRGIDALLHRRSDDAYLAVQAKARSSLHRGEVQLVVWANSLIDDKALIVGGLITDGCLGPTMLVVPEGDFKRLALPTHWNDQPIYAMSFGMRPRSDSRWLPYLVPTDHLAEKFSPSPRSGERDGERGVNGGIKPPLWRSDLGFLGESEVVRLLAEGGALNVFRPFPDLETSELALLHLENRRVLGVQVKTGSVDAGHPAERINIRESSFHPSSTTHFVVLAWLREENRFHEDCLLIPSTLVRSVCQPWDLDGHLTFDWYPGSAAQNHLNQFRTPIHGLRDEILERICRGE
jgi:hypothetical protein